MGTRRSCKIRCWLPELRWVNSRGLPLFIRHRNLFGHNCAQASLKIVVLKAFTVCCTATIRLHGHMRDSLTQGVGCSMLVADSQLHGRSYSSRG